MRLLRSSRFNKRGICDYELDPHSAGFVSAITPSPGEANGPSLGEALEGTGFLICTKIMVMLSHPSPPAVGAKHLSRTLSHTAESLLSYKNQTSQINHRSGKMD